MDPWSGEATLEGFTLSISYGMLKLLGSFRVAAS